MSKAIIDDITTAKVADLIKIKIPAADIPKYTSQLNTVLSSVDVLNQLDTSQTPETSQTHGLTNVLREDVAGSSLDMSKYRNTKNFRKGYFVVKKVL